MKDLLNLDTAAACDAGTEIELRHPVTQAPLGIFWSVKGKDSQAFRDHLRASINEDLRKAAFAKKSGRPEEIPTYEKSEEKSIEILVVCSTGWRTVEKVDGKDVSKPVIFFEGKEIEFDKAACAAVLRRLKWIRDQVDQAIGDLSNFLKN